MPLYDTQMSVDPNNEQLMDALLVKRKKEALGIHEESSGLLNNYYLCEVHHPQRIQQKPYQAECEDLIEALELNFDEANIFKEIWRSARQRQGTGKKGNTPLRSAEKIWHYASRILNRIKRETVKQA